MITNTEQYQDRYHNKGCTGDSTLQSSSYTATYHLSRKLSKLDEPDPQDTAGEVGANS